MPESEEIAKSQMHASRDDTSLSFLVVMYRYSQKYTMIVDEVV